MSLFTLVRQFVLSYRARHTQTHGGDNCVSDSETETNEQAEWMAIRETAKRANQIEREKQMQIPAEERRDEPAIEDDEYPQAILHNGQVILAGGHGADWIRANPDCTVYLEENV